MARGMRAAFRNKVTRLKRLLTSPGNPLLGLDFAAQAFGELLKKLALFLVQPAGNFHVNDHQLIAASVAAQVGHAFAAHVQDLAGLGPCRDLQGSLAIHRGDFHFGPQHGLGYVDVKIHQDVVFAAAEIFMRFYIDDDIQVPVGPAVDARLAFASQADLGIGIHARRNRYNLFARAAHLPAALAGVAGSSMISP